MQDTGMLGRLERREEWLRHVSAAARLSILAIPAIGWWQPQMLAPLSLTAILCASATLWLRDSYMRVLECLATDPDAYSIDAVRRFGQRILRPSERRRLAALIEDLISHTGDGVSLGLPDRLDAHREELREIARRLVSSDCAQQPTVIAHCRRLLIRAAESPLYNDHIPPEELAIVVHRIRFGLTAGR